ncbi:translation initiation factor Sui1 [Chitinibacter bivalviorum]|uniref:translation initiation factor Sui1 n=1 Tax=Chitinibacter bivalviorum TaxID=2739434 RepID=UPI001FED020B|nr:translation initiation factor Sui1 [Chitinibacter bivalviorum]
MKKSNQGGLVYSTEHGRMCPTCQQAMSQCQCKMATALPRGDGIVRITRETKGRNGKAVTVVAGVPIEAMELAQLAKELKALCGTGGTVKDGAIEIQGDHRELIAKKLQDRWKVKLAGG